MAKFLVGLGLCLFIVAIYGLSQVYQTSDENLKELVGEMEDDSGTSEGAKLAKVMGDIYKKDTKAHQDIKHKGERKRNVASIVFQSEEIQNYKDFTQGKILSTIGIQKYQNKKFPKIILEFLALYESGLWDRPESSEYYYCKIFQQRFMALPPKKYDAYILELLNDYADRAGFEKYLTLAFSSSSTTSSAAQPKNNSVRNLVKDKLLADIANLQILDTSDGLGNEKEAVETSGGPKADPTLEVNMKLDALFEITENPDEFYDESTKIFNTQGDEKVQAIIADQILKKLPQNTDRFIDDIGQEKMNTLLPPGYRVEKAEDGSYVFKKY